MKRGDVVVVALHGDLGKPRPAVIVETNRLAPTGHILVCPGTSHLVPEATKRRILIQPSAETGLREPTQFQIDKIVPARRDQCSAVIGRLDIGQMEQVDSQLMLMLGLTE